MACLPPHKIRPRDGVHRPIISLQLSRPFLIKNLEFENGFQNLGYKICRKGNHTVEWVSAEHIGQVMGMKMAILLISFRRRMYDL